MPFQRNLQRVIVSSPQWMSGRQVAEAFERDEIDFISSCPTSCGDTYVRVHVSSDRG